jgi:diaminopropionate ammonia-lyase
MAMDLWLNKTAAPSSNLPANLACRVSDAAATAPLRLLRLCPAYRTTPLVELPVNASSLNVASVLWKDESQRLGLNSFKALGGAYAVFALMEQRLMDHLGRSPTSDDWTGPVLPALAAGLTLAAATAGNHGLAVLAGARIIGTRCVIFVHEKVPEARRARLIAAGAELRVCPGDYEDSVDAAKTAADEQGMVLVPDTADQVDDPVSGSVVQGYGVLSREIIDQLAARDRQPPTHLFVQAGVGGLAASTAGVLSDHYRAQRPTIIVVEPDRARALITSLQAGQRVRTPETTSTSMDMLGCYEPSALAYEVLRRVADAFMTIGDAQAEEAAAALNTAHPTQPALSTTPSGAAGLAGLMALRADPAACKALKLDSTSRILLIGSEAGNAG